MGYFIFPDNQAKKTDWAYKPTLCFYTHTMASYTHCPRNVVSLSSFLTIDERLLIAGEIIVTARGAIGAICPVPID